jgi:GAF domain-containing protein
MLDDPSTAGADSADSPESSISARIADEFFSVLAETSGDADTVVPQLLAIIGRELGFEVATMWWWRRDQALLRCEQVWQVPGARFGHFLDTALGATLSRGDAVPGVVLESGKPVWVPEVAEHPDFRRAPAATAVGLRSGFAFPIRARGAIVGVFELFTAQRREPDEPLFAVVAQAAARLGDFIERLNLEREQARLLRDLEAAQRRQDFLLQANRALSATRGLAETIEQLAAVAVPAIGDLCLVDVVRGGGTIERLAARHAEPDRQLLADGLRRYPPDPAGDHPAAVAIRTGRSLTAPEMSTRFMADTTQSDGHLELTALLGFTSYMSAPLLDDGQPLGALTIVSAGSGRRFGPDDLALMEELAAQVASVIGRERRYDEQHLVAMELQRSMLPERLDPVAGLRVAARYMASNEATEVGGDFYDLVRLDETHVALIVGDIEGHDLVATTAMAKVRSVLTGYLELQARPAQVLDMLDRYVEHHIPHRMVTVVLGVLDLRSGELELVVAGHPPPLLVGTTVEQLIVAPGPPVGLGAGRYVAARFSVPSDAGLVFFTDGLIERRRGGPTARLERLLGAVALVDREDLEKACDAVIEMTMSDARPADDVAVLWAMRGPE